MFIISVLYNKIRKPKVILKGKLQSPFSPTINSRTKLVPNNQFTERGKSTRRNMSNIMNRTNISSFRQQQLPIIKRGPMKFSPPNELFSDPRIHNNSLNNSQLKRGQRQVRLKKLFYFNFYR